MPPRGARGHGDTSSSWLLGCARFALLLVVCQQVQCGPTNCQELRHEIQIGQVGPEVARNSQIPPWRQRSKINGALNEPGGGRPNLSKKAFAQPLAPRASSRAPRSHAPPPAFVREVTPLFLIYFSLKFFFMFLVNETERKQKMKRREIGQFTCTDR